MKTSRLELEFISCCVMCGVSSLMLDLLRAPGLVVVPKILAVGVVLDVISLYIRTRAPTFVVTCVMFAWVLLPKVFRF